MKKIIVLLVVMTLLLGGCDDKYIGDSKVETIRLDAYDQGFAAALNSSHKETYRREREQVRLWQGRLDDVLRLKQAAIATLRTAHAAEIAAVKERYLKSELIKPTDVWLDIHGDSLDSYKIFNTKLALENIKVLKGLKNDI
jgi:carboxylesterase type B